MTPVATPIAVRAITWDAALEETLSRGAAPDSRDARPVLARTPDPRSPIARVHSVHRRALNLLLDDELIAVVSDTLDDAPSTIRVPVPDWTALGVRQGDGVDLGPDGIRIETQNGAIAVLVGGAAAWSPSRACLCSVAPESLREAADRLDALPAPETQTAFGRIAADLLSDRIGALATALQRREPADVTAAASRILGLGEGLTPSGDDVLTGLAFVAAQRGMVLGRDLGSLSATLDDGADGTTLLSRTTVRHALNARARQSLHDLVAALRDGDQAAFDDAAARILQIGHTSGADILTGVALALRTEAALRAPSPAVPAAQTPGSDEKGAGR